MRERVYEIDDCDGYEVVCLDGIVRMYPFHNRGDAASAARIATSRGKHGPKSSSLELAHPLCTGGHHAIRTIASPTIH